MINHASTLLLNMSYDIAKNHGFYVDKSYKPIVVDNVTEFVINKIFGARGTDEFFNYVRCALKFIYIPGLRHYIDRLDTRVISTDIVNFSPYVLSESEISRDESILLNR